MVWLVSHLKATWTPNANLTQPPQWSVPGAIEEEASDARATFSALERLGARKLYRLRYIPRWIPIGVVAVHHYGPLTWGNAESG